MLTHDCREDFENWLKLEYPQYSMEQLESLPMSMKFGIYQDFFDSKDLSTKISEPSIHCTKWGYSIVYERQLYSSYGCNDPINRIDARDKVIKLSNKLYNDRLEKIRFHKELLKKIKYGY